MRSFPSLSRPNFASPRHEVSALLAVIDALKHFCRGELVLAEERRRIAERDIMRGMGMAEIDGDWRMPGFERNGVRRE